MKWLFLILGLFANAGASILIKIGVARNIIVQANLRSLLELLQNWPLLSGIMLYCIAFIFYALSLSKLPLNVVHPTMTAGSIVLVGLAAAFVFNEQFSPKLIVGFSMIVVGVLTVCISK